MSGEEVNRVRPASGLWSLLGWLRREHSASCDSLSSGGSARTAASFAFLPPAACAATAAAAAPRARPPPSPPSDSYRRRLRDRNTRRQQEQHLALHRKYHLPGLYDAYTLPPARRQPEERVKRAASEVGRRAAHVPGKRPAPPPPAPAAAPAPASLPRRRAKKRPAPPPPLTLPLRDKQKSLLLRQIEKIDFEMNNAKGSDQTNSDCKPEKYTRKDSNRPERSFLKQLFENKKRNSAIETSTVKLLPNISELDRQATELLQSYRLKAQQLKDTNQRESGPLEILGISRKDQNKAGTWICTSCLHKYDMTVATCLQCLLKKEDKKSATASGIQQYNSLLEGTSSNAPSTSLSEKEKLKQMLKEMKKSLPKRSKTNKIEMSCNKTCREERDSTEDNDLSKDAPTLPIGEALNEIKNEYQMLVAVNARMTPGNRKSGPVAGGARNILMQTEARQESGAPSIKTSISKDTEDKKESDSINCFRTEQMKISTFINPVYIPKPAVNVNQQPSQTVSFSNVSENNSKLAESRENKKQVVNVTTANSLDELSPATSSTYALPKTDHSIEKPISASAAAATGSKSDPTDKNNKEKTIKDINISAEPKFRNLSSPVKYTFPSTSIANAGTEKTKETIDQFRKRRDLINQLERSIATGDERAAADAAVQLAQLRLSCSVLSFSSQNAGANDAQTKKFPKNNHVNIRNATNDTKKSPTTVIPTASQVISPQSATIVEGSGIKTSNKAEDLPSSCSYSAAKQSASNNNLQQTQPSTSKAATTEMVNIEVWVEDKTAARGAAQLGVSRAWRLRELRHEAARALHVPAPLQRWIVGRTLCADDDAALTALAGAALDAPFYLCLVESDVTAIKEESGKKPTEAQDSGVYHELVQLERNDIVLNTETFECEVCLEECAPGAGCVLRECLHAFCRACLAEGIRLCAEGELGCPAPACAAVLQEREVRGLVSPADYERWLARGLARAESGARHAFHCRTRDCAGWALAEPPVQRFPCPVCRAVNCVPCQAIHDGETCDQYKIRLNEAAKVQGTADTMDDSTKTLIDGLISRGEALECPECKAIITKKWGCDWVRCSGCKTEICWVTRGRRWGPGGRGDTSAGCRCGVDGIRCHPSCAYCH